MREIESIKEYLKSLVKIDSELSKEEIVISGYCYYGNQKRDYGYSKFYLEKSNETIVLLETEKIILKDCVYYTLKVQPYIQKSKGEIAFKVLEIVEEKIDKCIYGYNHFMALREKMKNRVNLDDYIFSVLKEKKKNKIEEILNIGYICPKTTVAQSDIISQIKNEKYLSKVNLNINCYLLEDLKGLGEAEDEVDLWVVTRGGGNLEYFDTYDFIEKMYKLKKPIVSALGHSVDFVYTDIMADKYFETPTAFGKYLDSVIGKYIYSKAQNMQNKEMKKTNESILAKIEEIQKMNNEMNMEMIKIGNANSQLNGIELNDKVKKIVEQVEELKRKNSIISILLMLQMILLILFFFYFLY